MVAPRSFQQTVVKSSEGVVLPMQGASTTLALKSNEDSSSSVVGPLVGGVLGFLLGLGIVGLMLYALWSNFQKQQCKNDVVATSIVPVAWEEGRDGVVASVEKKELDQNQNHCRVDHDQDEVVAAAIAPSTGEPDQIETLRASIGISAPRTDNDGTLLLPVDED